MRGPKCRPLCAALAAAALACAATVALAEDPVRTRTADAELDRNGDGFQDVIVAGRSVHRDVDFDGRYDYTLSLAFKEYTTDGHHQYIASGFAPGVFEELTRKGLDNLCASERVAANWTAEHFSEFLYYHDGYGRLLLFDSSPGNDGRLAGAKPTPRYEQTVDFNPDGTVASVRGGGRSVALATFDYEKNVSSGTRMTLPRIRSAEDLAQIRAELSRVLEAAPENR